MYCWNCGRQNPDDNAYCGACGRKIIRSETTGEPGTPERVPTFERQPDTPTQSNPLVDEPRAVRERVITDPVASTHGDRRVRSSALSMYGLNEGIGESDYLLEEDEPRSAWRGVLAVVLLALIGLLVYKQWSVISASTRALAQRAGVSQSEPPKPNATEPAPAATNPDASVSAGDITVNNDETPATPPPADTPLSNEDPNKSAAPTPATPATQEEEQLDEQRSAAAPGPPPNAAQDNSQVDLAQKYLQGRGVVQDCARGVSLLRSAAGKSNAKAQIQLGALYATGHCVTQDKAAAYRWFAQAQDLEPNNSYVSRNLNSLWSSMTQDERQRAEER